MSFIIFLDKGVSYEKQGPFDGVDGETLGYAPAGILQTSFFLHDGNYNIYPVFIRYNSFLDVLQTVYPKEDGEAWFETYNLSGGGTTTMDLTTLLQNTTFTPLCH
jgi:hypothetical protein